MFDFQKAFPSMITNSYLLQSILTVFTDFDTIGWLLFFLMFLVYAISKDQWFRLRKELHRYAMFDLLTGLPNRRHLEDRAQQTIRLCERRGEKFTLMLGDLNHFKSVNDTLGHHAGDELLKQVAKRISQAIRTSDTLARLGGDEFAFIIHSHQGDLGITQVCQRLQAALAEPFELDGHLFQIGISLGGAIFPEEGATLDELLRRADVSMYQAKEAQSDFVFYRDAFDSPADKNNSRIA